MGTNFGNNLTMSNDLKQIRTDVLFPNKTFKYEFGDQVQAKWKHLFQTKQQYQF